ncbi:DUF6603 domain-containing protein [Candidatus Odyssella acanthamoebae]|uniref:DUF6603 domain-containing protein n=1 Tax=Candidatus Odyssella acanthamoebae TaxID=91604 RepID=A0A077ATG8_9PROT|nr:DUF6603 domain-containing protein [Candidatus Paracaedibacter acanthamoebae]AIK95696.1 hypothetical protein ID47_01485 [Candidatus Paracaedibacter acanthamoebae]
MTLQTLQTTLSQLNSTNISEAVISNAGLTPREDLDNLLQSALMLTQPLNVNIVNVGTADDTSLVIQATGSFLNLSSINLQIEFVLNQDITDVIINATLPDNQGQAWQFADSFPYMVIYPFYNISFNSPSFIFSSYGQPYTWQSQPLSLTAGLNFASFLPLDSGFVGLVSNFFSTPPSGEILFSGSVDTSVIGKNNIVWPSVNFSGLMSDQPSDFIPGLEFTNPIITLTSQIDLDDMQSYSLNFSVTEDQIGLNLETQLQNNAVVGFSIVPSDSTNPPSLNTVVQLIPGLTAADITNDIPQELQQSFSAITFVEASCTLCINPINILSMTLVLSAGSAWAITDEFTVKSLTLSYTVLDPLGTPTNIFGFNGVLSFYPEVFKGLFDIQISIDTTNNNLLVSGSYQGIIDLNTITTNLCNLSLPSQFSSINVTDFVVSFNKINTNWTWGLFCNVDGTFPLPFVQGSVDCNLSASLSSNSYYLEGGLTIGGSYFNVSFDSNLKNSVLAGYWKSLSSDDLLGIQSLADAVGIKVTIPTTFDLDLTQAGFSYNLTQNTVKLEATSLNYGKGTFATFLPKGTADQYEFYFNLDVQTDIVILSQDLPLIGQEFSTADEIALKSLNITYASASLPNVNPIKNFNSGLDIKGVLSIAGDDHPFDLDFGPAVQTESGGAPSLITDLTATSSTPPPTPPGVWVNIQKTVGPISLKRIGLNYQNDLMWIMLDASLNTTNLNIALTGLSVGMNVSNSEPDLQFALHGLDVDLTSDDIVINGGLLSADDSGGTEYDGTLTVKVGEFDIAALASYAMPPDDQSSLFAFAVIDFPLGGPPAFFITGGAGGFGYNRDLIMPNISSIMSFPLIEIAQNPSKYKNENLSSLLQTVQSAIPIEQGQYWLAAGINFNSYGMVNSYLLAAAAFGTQLELDLLGVSTIVAPPLDPDPVAMIQFAIETTLVPAEGLFSVEGQLTNNSYVLSKNCHLTGGFAFYLWFGSNPHAGDFVISLGGYSPKFKKPSYYPTVPLLGLNWQVCPELSIQGGLYCAITSLAIMVGGSLKALWQSDGIRAWFNLDADVLLFWQPYQYTIDANVDVGASLIIDVAFVNTAITAHTNADLSIWGPDFTGKAKVDLYIISFTISFGDSEPITTPPAAISWSNFKQSFLSTDPSNVCNLNLAHGVIKSDVSDQGITYDWIVDPEHFIFTTGSSIPSKTLSLNGVAQTLSTMDSSINTDFGVGMVRAPSDSFTSDHAITLTYLDADGNEPYDIADKFNISLLTSNVPQSLWQCITSLDDLETSVASSSTTTIANTLSGISFSAKVTPADQVTPVALHNLLYSIDFEEDNLISYNKPSVPTTDGFTEEPCAEIGQTIAKNTSRTSILTRLQTTSFKIINDINVTSLSTEAANVYFVGDPILSYLGEEKVLGGAS